MTEENNEEYIMCWKRSDCEKYLLELLNQEDHHVYWDKLTIVDDEKWDDKLKSDDWIGIDFLRWWE